MTSIWRSFETLRSAAAALRMVAVVWSLAACATPSDPPTALGGQCRQLAQGRAYWIEDGWCATRNRGPDKAVGLLIWAHGVKGYESQNQSRFPLIVDRLYHAGWDVIRHQRNGSYESSWAITGTRHVRDLAERVQAARDAGYRRVILAGQSYGGALAIEVAGGIPVYGVIAYQPGHGSDASLVTPQRNHETLFRQLVRATTRMQAERATILVAPGDVHHPYDGDRGPALRAALRGFGVVISDQSPVRGHFAGYDKEFNDKFLPCLTRLFNPQIEPRGCP
ncbi:MAG: alpha/beta hydrolase [Alphaproteobacteria bacterium]|nr:alpha/beta hydrolase [Alphaproteobacteria bacterium]